MSVPSLVIGIDLGTTYSAVARITEAGQPAIIQNKDGKSTMPSVVYFGDREPMVGDEAKAYKAIGDELAVDFFKRQMGDTTWSLDIQGRPYSATDLSALVLGRLRKEVEEVTGEMVVSAVITVPAYFNDRQRRATVKAGEMAGLKVTSVINEPTAAALAYGWRHPDMRGRILVYDLGGGTFDVTLLEYNGGGSDRVLAVDGDHMLGGKDWDDALMRYLDSEFHRRNDISPLENATAAQELSFRCEEAKRQLTVRESVTVRVAMDGLTEMIPVTRTKFDELTAELLRKTMFRVEAVLEEAFAEKKENERWDSLDGVLLVGGSTRMPQVRRLLEERLGRPLLGGINVDEAVALGAVIQADADVRSGMHATPCADGMIRKSLMADVMSHSLGVVAENKDRSAYVNSILIPKNSPVPCSHTLPYAFRTRKGYDSELDVYVLQGELASPLKCAVIRKCVISDIAHQPGGRSVLDVTYAYNESGIVDISAVQRGVAKLRVREEPLEADLSWLGQSPRERDSETIVPHVAIWLALDVSGSMSGAPIQMARDAGLEFIRKIDLSHSAVGIVAFSDTVKILCEPSKNTSSLHKALEQFPNIVKSGTCGYGNSDDPFSTLLRHAPQDGEPCFIVLLTDGVWSNQSGAIKNANRCHQAGMEIIAMGFGGADNAFLKALATSEDAAIFTDLGRIGDCFSRIAQVLTEDGGLTGGVENTGLERKTLFDGI